MFKKIGSLFLVLLLGGFAALAVLNVQYIQDVISYRQYQPDGVVASFVGDTGMNEQGKFLFYASQPSLHGAGSFNDYCGKTDTSAAILGCYDGQRIYIYDVQDVRLAGIKPTTAAHEMLHAAYMRLSESERTTVNTLLEAEFDKLKNDSELAERMKFYERTQPGERYNELHSIIGTEVRTISPALEEYYKRYFVDRSKVIDQREKYYSYFHELRTRREQLRSQIESLSIEITGDRASYNQQASSLQADIASFNNRAETGGFESLSDFNRERQALMARSASLDRLREKINSAITEYNRLVREAESIAIETEELNRSLDSSLAPAPSL